MSEPAVPLKVLVADDHPAVLEAVADYLESAGLRVAGRARDGEEALARVVELEPDLILLDEPAADVATPRCRPPR